MSDRSYITEKIKEKRVLIAAHQGTFGGNIGANTISSGKNALLHGADIIEADVTRDKEGVLYMFHDAHEPFNFAVKKHIPEMTTKEVSALKSFNSNGDKCLPGPVRLLDYLDYFKDRDCIINLDRCWNIWDEVNEIVKKFDMFGRIIYKSPYGEQYCEFVKKCRYPMIYMPIVSSIDQAKEALRFKDQIAGFEVLYKTEDDGLCSDRFIDMCKNEGIVLWSNAMTLNDTDILSAGHDDNSVIEDGKNAWEWHFGKGFDIVQTDWPALWVGFRERYFGKEMR